MENTSTITLHYRFQIEPVEQLGTSHYNKHFTLTRNPLISSNSQLINPIQRLKRKYNKDLLN